VTTVLARLTAVALVTLGLLLGLSQQAIAAGARTTGAQATAACSATKLTPVTYTAFDGHTESLTPWEGAKVAVLVEAGVRSASVMGKMVCALDKAWSYYHTTTGETPTPHRTTYGRTDVAEVSATCGAGCTFLGEAGTEILRSSFEYGYNEIAQYNLYDQVSYYEFGRSFWFWTNQLSDSPPCTVGDPATTGFAVWMRFRSMAAAGVNGAPFNGITPFSTFKSQVVGLEGVYDANTSDTFEGTLCRDLSPAAYGGTDFWASIMMKLASLYGGQKFVARFWQHLGSLPSAASTPAAITNWVDDAEYASCVDLTNVFYQRWAFPQPDGVVISPRPSAGSVPFPVGHC
jgi:hypothetical protein